MKILLIILNILFLVSGTIYGQVSKDLNGKAINILGIDLSFPTYEVDVNFVSDFGYTIDSIQNGDEYIVQSGLDVVRFNIDSSTTSGVAVGRNIKLYMSPKDGFTGSFPVTNGQISRPQGTNSLFDPDNSNFQRAGLLNNLVLNLTDTGGMVSGLNPDQVLFGKSDGTIEQDSSFQVDISNSLLEVGDPFFIDLYNQVEFPENGLIVASGTNSTTWDGFGIEPRGITIDASSGAFFSGWSHGSVDQFAGTELILSRSFETSGNPSGFSTNITSGQQLGELQFNGVSRFSAGLPSLYVQAQGVGITARSTGGWLDATTDVGADLRFFLRQPGDNAVKEKIIFRGSGDIEVGSDLVTNTPTLNWDQVNNSLQLREPDQTLNDAWAMSIMAHGKLGLTIATDTTTAFGSNFIVTKGSFNNVGVTAHSEGENPNSHNVFWGRLTGAEATVNNNGAHPLHFLASREVFTGTYSNNTWGGLPSFTNPDKELFAFEHFNGGSLGRGGTGALMNILADGRLALPNYGNAAPYDTSAIHGYTYFDTLGIARKLHPDSLAGASLYTVDNTINVPRTASLNAITLNFDGLDLVGSNIGLINVNAITLNSNNNITGTSSTIDFDAAGRMDLESSQGVNLMPHGGGAGNTTELRFVELVGGNYVSLKPPDALSANVDFELPDSLPATPSAFFVDAVGKWDYKPLPTSGSGTFDPTETHGGSHTEQDDGGHTWKYSRQDSIVTVTGWIQLTGGNTTAIETVDWSLPIASNFTSSRDVTGSVTYTQTSVVPYVDGNAVIFADTINDTIQVNFIPLSGGDYELGISIQYTLK